VTLAKPGIAFICAVMLTGCALVSSEKEPVETTALPVAGSTAGQLYQAYVAFEEAREAGDAVRMAHALQQRPVVIAETLEISEEFLVWRETTDRMKRDTLQMAKGDPDMLAAIGAIMRKGQFKEQSLSQHDPDVHSFIGRIRPEEHTRVIRVGANSKTELALKVVNSRGAIVYAENGGMGNISLTIQGKDELVICRDDSSHGALICRWRPSMNDKVIVIIENTGTAATRILTVTSQQLSPRK